MPLTAVSASEIKIYLHRVLPSVEEKWSQGIKYSFRLAKEQAVLHPWAAPVTGLLVPRHLAARGAHELTTRLGVKPWAE